MTPLYKISSIVLRIRSTGDTIRCNRTASSGTTTKRRIRAQIHHATILGLSFAHGLLSGFSTAKDSTEEPFQRSRHRLHCDAETLHGNSIALYGRLAAGSS